MQGYKGEDHMMDTREFRNGCGGWGGRKVDELKEDEGTGRSK